MAPLPLPHLPRHVKVGGVVGWWRRKWRMVFMVAAGDVVNLVGNINVALE